MEDLKRLKNRIDWFCENKINAFSPTISPAPKSPERKEIESIDKAIRYFYDNGIKEVVVEKKYMGSYCDIYLNKNLEDTYFVSRNGHKIDHIDLDAAKEACRELHARFDWTNLQLIIIQSELMPWSSMGKGLIENEFGGYLNVHQNHFEHLANSSLYKKIEAVRESDAYKQFIEDKNMLSTKDLRAKYPHHIIRQYESLFEFKVLDLTVYKQSIDVYETQINHFGQQGDIYFKPFNILKKVFDDGSEEFVNDNLSYKEVNDDEFLHLSIDNDTELDQSIETVYSWFATLEKNSEEGIVIKPRQAFIKGMPPAFKVRNNQYLTMIYGVNFHDQYGYYIYKRNIGRKLECSINDWMLNWELLKVPYKDINKENYFLKNLVFDRIMGEKAEAGLDTRL
ncbi:hypothetical protein GGR21_004041 [Dysgonomonas hofstadii]|uniref:Polynucleotide kinase-phosphatase ligase domain-containing protein n=1 Tax=Dysgonomonas hofstadii TaxID=637886 RepID=A0A840D0E5_9BACT|nr:hypothetical protein [Dysgonomonas hofstadii]MBB4038112.1 hypothetical protein [Dysgonomonas hofstadii]